MKDVVYVILIASVLCGVNSALGSGCDNSECRKMGLIKFYSELNCTPINENDSCCPTRYDCSKISLRSNGKCHYQGNEYELHSHVSTNETIKNCLASCGCYSNDDDMAYFNCAHVECPELFLGPLKDPGCFRQYSHDTCCSVSTFCFNSTSEEENGNIYQCEYGGKKYYKGQKFYPKGECKTCICDEGYDGSSNEPWCEEFPCSIELLQLRRISEGCVPVYFNSGCCPVDWRCPSENDTVIPGPLHQTPTQENDDNQLICNFGNLKMFLHDKLADNSGNSQCTCLIPPFVTCSLKSS